MKKMNTVKRIVAFSLALIMIVLAPLQHTNAYTIVDNADKIIADTTNNLLVRDQGAVSGMDRIEAMKEALKQNGGVINSPDAVPSEKTELNVLGNGDYTLTEVDWSTYGIDLKLNKSASEQILSLVEGGVSAEDLVPVIIEFDNESILEADNNAEANGFTELKAKVLSLVQTTVINRIENKVFGGAELEITSDFTWVMNGVGTVVPYGSIEQIKEVNGVRNVYIQNVYEVADVNKEDASLMTAVDGSMIGREDAWAEYGYTGKGIKIAIIDTGIDEDHPNFAALPETALTDASLDATDIGAVLEQLNAYEVNSSVTAETLYYNTKIAYGFNYADRNLTINHSSDSQGDHGTHVAGIAAANKIEGSDVVGVAPDAQVMVMKVYGAYDGGRTELLLMAIEDAVILGADVINMSLGSSCGFSSTGDAVDAVYETISESGVILAISAGNSGTVAEGNESGINANKTSDPDNATISQPSTFINATSVASVNNTAYLWDYILVNGEKLYYVESTYDESQTVGTIIEELGGQTLQFAMVGNCGQTLEDFVNAGVEGKVAVVSRGENYFYEKYMLAAEAGAIAIFIYNNVPNEEMGANLQGADGTVANIPCIGISMESAAIFQAAADAGNATVFIAEDQTYFPVEDAYQMSSFSSWGVTPDLQLKPDITAPGGYIYSTTDEGTYGIMSGTSMASPNVAGMAALLKQYVVTKYPEMTDEEVYTFINAILTSSAGLLVNEDGIYYSPRQQGSGLANVLSALNTNAYLSVEDETLPKVSLFDDPDKAGVYNYEFTVHNFGTVDLWYSIDTIAQTEGYIEYEGEEYMSSTPELLGATTKEYSENIVLKHNLDNDGDVDLVDIITMLVAKDVAADEKFRYDLNEDNSVNMNDAAMVLGAMVGKDNGVNLDELVVEVEAGKEVDITVSVKLTAEDKAYMDAHFENGIYVEGFTVLTAYNDGVDLSLPYMGFYGDWTDAPIFDSGYFWEEGTYMQYPHVLWTEAYGQNWFPGLNPYLNEEFDPSYMSVSPDGDGFTDSIEDIYLSLMRNARELYITYTNAETGEEYFESFAEYCMKSYYMDQYGQIVPYVASWDTYPLYDFRDDYGNALPDGTKVNITCEAYLDYDTEESDTIEFSVYVDTTAPEIMDSELVVENGKQYLELTIKDSCATAAIMVLSAQGTLVRAILPAEKGNAGETIENKIDITGCGNNFMIVLGDYAGNERAYQYETTDNDPEIDTTKLYGYRISDEMIADDTLYGWLAIDKKTAKVDTLSSEYYVDYALTAATYVDGTIFAVDASNALLMIKPGYWDERITVADLGIYITQLALDPKTGILYAFDHDSYNDRLVTISLDTGEVTPIGSVGSLYGLMAMTCDADGNLYGINSSGELMKIDKATGEFDTDNVLATLQRGTRRYSFSMAYDEANEMFFVADMYYISETRTYCGELVSIDAGDDYEVSVIDTIAGNAQMVGLMVMESKGYSLPSPEISGIQVKYDEVTMIAGQSSIFTAVKTPFYVEEGEVTWSSSDEEVASVNGGGYVTAIKEGTATITATVTVDGVVKGTDSFDLTVKAPETEFEAYAIYGDYNYSWIKFNTNDLKNASMQTVDNNVYTVGEYYDGYIYAYSGYNEFYKIDATTKEATQIAPMNSSYYFLDMTYDYTNGWMYVVAMSYISYQIELLRVDIETGELMTVGAFFDAYGGSPMAIAAATDGTLYAISNYGFLCKVDLENEKLVIIGFTGYFPPGDVSSLAWDHTDGGLYYSAPFEGLIYIDEKTGLTANIGQPNGPEAWNVAMFTKIADEDVPDRAEVPVEEIVLKKDVLLMVSGMQASLPVSVYPFNATDRTVSCDIPEQAQTILSYENGMLTALAPGDATVTITAGEHEVELKVVVKESAGALRGFIMFDFATYGGYFWGEFKDNDLSKGALLAYQEHMDTYASESVYGTIYSYGQNYTNDNIDFIKETLDEENGEVSVEVIGSFDYKTFPDPRDMSFDYSENSLYLLAGVRNSDSNTSLYNVDLSTGQVYLVGEMDAVFAGIAFTTKGQLYGITAEGIFCSIDKETGEYEKLFETGYYGMGTYQSMTYDHNTGNIYWAQGHYDQWEGIQDFNLVLIDIENEMADAIGMIGQAGCMVVGLHVPLADSTILPEVQTVTKDLFLSKDMIFLGAGNTEKLYVSAFPNQLGVEYEYTYSSEDETIATVDQDGNITAVAEGSTTINVTYNGKTASCDVVVIGSNYQLQAFTAASYDGDPAGVGTANLLETDEYATWVNFENEGFTLATADYSAAEDCYYVVDTNGYLWKLEITEGEVGYTKIGEKSILELYENYASQVKYPYDNGGIVDVVVNPFDGNLYVVMRFTDKNDDPIMYLCKVDKQTAVPTVLGQFVDGYIYEFEFVSATEIIYYDGFMDYIRKADIETKDENGGFIFTNLAWVQYTMQASEKCLGMDYCSSLNAIFFVTNDYQNNSGNVALYMMDLSTSFVTKIADTPLHAYYLRDICIISE